jgi:large subunit ribosomal protein L10
LAISKQEKEAILEKYKGWLERSKAMVLVEYTGAKMADLDTIRTKVREAGGEFHIMKNTLTKLALATAGLPVTTGALENSTAVGFAFENAADVAKVLAEFDKNLEAVKIKGGYLGKQFLNTNEVKALANLPPLPVVRGRLLGTILAPAGKLVRTLAEPGRQVAAVIKGFADKNAGSVAA